MENKTLVVGLIMLLVGLGIGYTLSSGSGRQMGNGGEMRGNIDQHFIVQMIPHHEGAIAMAQIALERSKRPEVLSLAQGIIDAQTRENADMRAWYEDWFGSAPPSGGMGMEVHGMTGDSASLQSVSDADFDREFLSQMIPHHEMAIMMASMLKASDRPEMLTLADQIITSQSREIDMMRSWLQEWYGVNVPENAMPGGMMR